MMFHAYVVSQLRQCEPIKWLGPVIDCSKVILVLMGDIFPILPSATLDLGQFFVRELLARGEVPGVDLCVNLYTRVLGDHI